MSISVIIPAYNSAAFLPDAVNSIRRQNVAVDEIIIVDDGSVDNTEGVVQRLGGNVHYIKEKNQGPAAARNNGIRQANSEWIAFLDADDQWTDNKLQLQLDCLAKYPQLQLIAGDMAETDANSNIVTASMLQHHGQLAVFEMLGGKPIPDACASLVQKNFIPTGTVLARKQVLLDAGLFPEHIRFGEDLALWAQVAAIAEISCLPQVLMLRRRHDNNATDSTEGMLTGLVQVMSILKEKCGEVLQQQGLSAQASLAQACFDLGYWQFHHKSPMQSREALNLSWANQKSFKTAAYLCIASLPKPLAHRFMRNK
ncbi:MAG: glycosyltransferase [Chromatiales bacterium]